MVVKDSSDSHEVHVEVLHRLDNVLRKTNYMKVACSICVHVKACICILINAHKTPLSFSCILHYKIEHTRKIELM